MSLHIGRKRATQIFRYLEALNQHRNPVRRQLDDQLWHLWFRDLPEHSGQASATHERWQRGYR